MSQPIKHSPLRSLYLRWRALRLPWRRKFLIGEDLAGNTYWEFRDNLSSNPNRMRRIVQAYRGSKIHHSDVQVSPQWHQWLRQTRTAPPTLQEQQTDVLRMVQLKQNARLADERWASKANYIEKPNELNQQSREPQQKSAVTGNTGGMMMDGMQDEIRGGDAPKTEPNAKERVREEVVSTEEQVQQTGKRKITLDDDPWERERQKLRETTANPSGTWQPAAWTPGGAGGASKRR